MRKNYGKTFLICLFIAFTLPSMNYGFLRIYSDQDITITNNNENEDISSSNGYLLVDPINITSGSDWANYDFITGNGSSGNPYIIENVQILGDGIKTYISGNRTLLNTTYTGIYINAGGSFIIRNSKISHTSIGIHLSVGISPGSYPISNVEISDCSLGIYSRWPHAVVNISNCYVHDCNWVSIKANIVVMDLIENCRDHGGVGICVRSNAGIINNCRIEDCSIGMVAGLVQQNHHNEFINCGFVPDHIYSYVTNYSITNTVNGKPIGIFGSYWGNDNMVFTQSNASQYGQLIFEGCNNLTLSNIHISKPCSIGIQVISVGLNQTNYLNNIICENQKLGICVYGKNIIGDNLYVKNSDAGFNFIRIENSTISKLMTDNTDVPIYAITPIEDFTIEIERSTDFYLVDYAASSMDILDVNPGNDILMSNITDLGIQGYQVQFENFGTYHLNLTLDLWVPIPVPHETKAYFTIISVPRNIRPDVWAPVITIIFPADGDIYGNNAPTFNVRITDDHLDTMWYSLDGGVTIYVITTNTTINQAVWDALSEGSIKITFYANDTAGNLSFEEVTITKVIPSKPFDPTFIVVITVISIIGGVAVIVGVYILMKKRVIK